jgi:hypothetical protein
VKLTRLRDSVRRKESLTCGWGKWLLNLTVLWRISPFGFPIYLSTGDDACLPVSVLASLASVDFFPKLKYALKGRGFESVDGRKFTGRAMRYSKRGIPGMFPKFEETHGAMYEEWSSVL